MTTHPSLEASLQNARERMARLEAVGPFLVSPRLLKAVRMGSSLAIEKTCRGAAHLSRPWRGLDPARTEPEHRPRPGPEASLTSSTRA